MATYEEIISDYTNCSITNNQAVDALMAIGWENNEAVAVLAPITPVCDDDDSGSSDSGSGSGILTSAGEYISDIVEDTWEVAVPTTKATIKAAVVGFIPLLELALLAGLTVAIVKAPAKLFGIGVAEE